jgi:hypothetical protein
MAEKPIPRALYPCHFCNGEYSYYANELFWSEIFQAWVCDNRWGDHDEYWEDHDEHWEPNNDPCYDYGISLEEELYNRAQKFLFSKNIKEAPNRCTNIGVVD